LYCVIIHPQIEIKTSESRKILPKKVSLKNVTKQLTNLGGLIHGLHTNNYDLIKSSLKDELIEVHRSKLIPLFKEVKQNSINSGAIGCSISGSGPSIFSLCKGKKIAKKIEKSIINIYSNSGIEFSTYISKINKKGVYSILES
jgi:homoserine kinase